MERPLYIPVILGTARKGRASELVARFVLGEVTKREGVERHESDAEEGGVVIEAHTCSRCGRSATRPAGADDVAGE